jgi:4-hydroxy-3-methylbut-2-enyl diphosphate reductase
VSNTICNATEVRQNEAKELAACCDAMIVVGGRSSSNTQKLYEICAGECSDTYFIQSAKDFDSDTLERLKKVEHIGITAGASTPKNIIQEVFDICKI